jgi:hypothetical protein
MRLLPVLQALLQLGQLGTMGESYKDFMGISLPWCTKSTDRRAAIQPFRFDAKIDAPTGRPTAVVRGDAAALAQRRTWLVPRQNVAVHTGLPAGKSNDYTSRPLPAGGKQ